MTLNLQKITKNSRIDFDSKVNTTKKNKLRKKYILGFWNYFEKKEQKF